MFGKPDFESFGRSKASIRATRVSGVLKFVSPLHCGVPRFRPGSGCSCRSSFVGVGSGVVGVCGWLSRIALRCSDQNAGGSGQGLGRSCVFVFSACAWSLFLVCVGLPCAVSLSQDKNGGGLGEGLGRSCVSSFLRGLPPCRC